jgi:ribosomal protein S2
MINLKLIMKELIKFSIKELIFYNIHLGESTQLWHPLNRDLVLGFKQKHFFLNLNLTILNLRKTFNLIESFLYKNYKIIFYTDNIFVKNLLITNYFFLKKLKFYFGLGRWMPGFLTNFKTFYFVILKYLKPILNILKLQNKKLNTIFSNFILFFIFLNNFKFIPSCIFSFNINSWLINEARQLTIPSSILLDNNISERSVIRSTFLIPFNYLNSRSLLFLIINLQQILIITLLRKKKLFFNLLLIILKNNINFNINKDLYLNFNFGFSLLLNLLKFNKYNIKLLNLLIIKLIKLNKYNNFKYL